MTGKHTPGPWTQGRSNTGRTCVWVGGSREPEHGLGPCSEWIDCETEANARLIAKAPELHTLALRIARLNRDAGEIGAGMLAALVDEARRLTDES